MEKVVRKYKLGEEPSVRSYWMTKSEEERIHALELLIRTANVNEDETSERLQRVYRITGRKSG
jgi:hypothetical protein